MHVSHENMAISSQFKQLNPQHQVFAEIECRVGVLRHAPDHLRVAFDLRKRRQVNARNRYHGCFLDNLHGLALHTGCKTCTQAFMACKQTRQCLVDCGVIQVTAQGQGEWHVVMDTAILNLVQYP